jgi:hypothetical protein
VGLRSFITGFCFAFLLIGCTGFSYKYYGLKDVNYSNGTLLGPEAKDDKPFMNCAPSASVKNPCVIIFANEFFKMKQDYLDTKTKLADCEKRNP